MTENNKPATVSISAEDVLKAFDGVITQIQSELEKTNSLKAYVKLEGRLEAYADSKALVSRYFESVSAAAEPANLKEENIDAIVEETETTKKTSKK